MALVFWALILTLFALATRLGRHLNLIPIVSQLLLATFGVPLLMLLWVEPGWQLTGAQLVAPVWLKTLYGMSFALVLGHILSDVIDVRLDRQSLKVAIPSFCMPLLCGVACALWMLNEQSWLSALAIGLVFAITAIPVLYLYLNHIGYPPDATRRLVQTAIMIDLACWSLFGLAQGSLHLSSLALPLLGACAPLLLRALNIRQPKIYGTLFFALLMAAEHYRLNALIFGIGYLLCMNALKQPFALPFKPERFKALQQYLAIPLILTFGIVQINVHSAMGDLGWPNLLMLILTFGIVQINVHSAMGDLGWPNLLMLIALPIVSKILGNWMGLRWATPSFAGASRWRESLLLNIRGLSEIVFLNLLLQQQIITPALYFALMSMSLIATLLPALAGMHRPLPKPLAPHATPADKETSCQ